MKCSSLETSMLKEGENIYDLKNKKKTIIRGREHFFWGSFLLILRLITTYVLVKLPPNLLKSYAT